MKIKNILVLALIASSLPLTSLAGEPPEILCPSIEFIQSTSDQVLPFTGEENGFYTFWVKDLVASSYHWMPKIFVRTVDENEAFNLAKLGTKNVYAKENEYAFYFYPNMHICEYKTTTPNVRVDAITFDDMKID